MSKLTNALFDYQKKDVEFLLNHPRSGNCNPMGLGKTIESLATMEQLKPKHTLIVCKRPYINEWFNQVTDWLGWDCLTPWEGPGDKLGGLDLNGPPVVCVNYDLLGINKYWAELARIKWDCIIYDEAHKLKNYKAQRTKNAFLIPAKNLYTVTGSPLQNNPIELYPMFHLWNPREYHNVHWWMNTFCEMEEKEIWFRGQDGKSHCRQIKQLVPGGRNNVEALNALLHLYIVRHEKSEVMPNLPPKRRRVVPIDLGPEKAQYLQMQDQLFTMLDNGETIKSPNVITQLLRLRQICLEPNLLASDPEQRVASPSNKTQALLDILEDAEEKCLVFSFFERYISIIDKLLTERGINHISITGKNSPSENSRRAHAFQDDDSIRAAIGTIGAMGESWTLTKGKVVIFTDLFWNPAINDQCEERSYGRANEGLDQKESTLIIDLFCRGTAEEHVHQVVWGKQEMIDEVVIQKNVLERMRRTR